MDRHGGDPLRGRGTRLHPIPPRASQGDASGGPKPVSTGPRRSADAACSAIIIPTRKSDARAVARTSGSAELELGPRITRGDGACAPPGLDNWLGSPFRPSGRQPFHGSNPTTAVLEAYRPPPGDGFVAEIQRKDPDRKVHRHATVRKRAAELSGGDITDRIGTIRHCRPGVRRPPIAGRIPGLRTSGVSRGRARARSMV